MLISHSKTIVMPKIFINYNKQNENDPQKIFNMDCINLSPQPYIKYLGVLIDPNLTFKHQVASISKKVSQSLYFLRNSKNILNEKSLKSIYYATFHSHLVYANQLWSCCADSTIKPLINLNKDSCPLLFKQCGSPTPSEDLIKQKLFSEMMTSSTSPLPGPTPPPSSPLQLFQEYGKNFPMKKLSLQETKSNLTSN